MPDSQSLEGGGYETEPAKPTLASRARLAIEPYIRFWPWAAGVLGVIVLAWAIWGRGEPAAPYTTAAVDRGEIMQVVSATGALAPLVSVNVGSTVSGLVKTVEADFNSEVTENQVLARLDAAPFQQRVAQAQATLSQAQAQYAVANSDYGRYATLAQRGFASQQLMATQRASRDSAAAGVAQARAALAAVQIDLDRTVIRSPIRGTVVDRQVNVGQSVAASLQAPILFVIAQDLSRLQANITVDEADIGEVRENMPVRFTVDAFPDSEFEGRVSQVRQLGVQNTGVVSYTVVVQADNPRGQLLPGMTANAEIIVAQTENVMRLPNAALRFRPSDPALVARAQAMTSQASSGGGERRQGAGGGQGGQEGRQGGDRAGRGVARLTEQLQLTEAQQAQARAAYEQATASAGSRPGADAAPAERRAYQRRIREAALRAIEPNLNAEQRQLLEAMRNAPPGETREVRRQAVIWVLRDNKLEPVRAELGVADDSFTVILGGDLREGDQVVTGGGPQAEEEQRGNRGGRNANPLGGGGGARIRGA